MFAAIGKLIGLGDVARPLCHLAGNRERLRVYTEALPAQGIEGQFFDSVPQMLEAALSRAPDLVFVDLGLGVAAARAAIERIAALPTRGAIQLVAPVKVTTYEQVGAVGQLRLHGDKLGIKMPQVLQPPYDGGAVKKLAQEFGLRRNDNGGKPIVTLKQAMKRNWLELWYQPKIDLATKRLVGAEGLIRIRHPKHGIMFPGSFLPGASEADMLQMTEQVILASLRDWEELSANGVSVRLSVNAPVSAFTKLPLAAMLREERPRSTRWPGLIIEVTEDEIVKDLNIANEVAAELRAHHCTLAIDDFGAGYSSLARLKQLPFSELKIDRSYVTDCNKDEHNAGLCETIVELARRFGLKTVAEGIETHHESHRLQGVGCDVGQGYLFAKPMAKEQFISLLRRRMVGNTEQAEAVRSGRSVPSFSPRFGA
jgi:EAL domain-containing protein (putative c-di-GMP-specific phosphodiesterase class I)/CheY-like chemotaxis protein